MECPRCSALTPDARSSRGPAPRAGELCPDCGRLQPPAGMAERLFNKLSELARFGLLDHAAPILKTPGSSGEDID